MREEEINEKIIKFELEGICQDCIYLDKIVSIIREMLSEEYKTGLEQAKFDKKMLEQELQEYKENHECVLRQRDDIIKNATEQIESLIDEKNKYKSLYQNEKDKNDTLIRIVEKVKCELEKHLNAKSYGNHKYELFDRKYLEDLLDLLKDIK